MEIKTWKQIFIINSWELAHETIVIFIGVVLNNK